MTVIAYRNGVMAADSATFQGEVCVATDTIKLRRTSSGMLVGCACLVPEGEMFHQWAEEGFALAAKPEPFGDFGALVVEPNGIVWRFDAKLRRYPASENWSVEGCYEDFMHGALAAGAGAEDAVWLAIEYCAYAGGNALTLRLDGR